MTHGATVGSGEGLGEEGRGGEERGGGRGGEASGAEGDVGGGKGGQGRQNTSVINYHTCDANHGVTQ